MKLVLTLVLAGWPGRRARAVIDAPERSSVSSSGDGLSLRGGTFGADYSDLTLAAVRWTDDVALGGTWLRSVSSRSLVADRTVDGPGGLDGPVDLHGGWLIPPRSPTGPITGTLGGRHLAADGTGRAKAGGMKPV